MKALQELNFFLERHSGDVGKVVDFNSALDQLLPLDFTENNKELNADILADTNQFSNWVDKKLQDNKSRYGIGGYNEHRTIYSRSNHFDTMAEPRRLHLGTDIWGAANTPIFNFYDAKVHSFNFNKNFGDYGATIILEYEFNGLVLYCLYGHLSLASLANLEVGMFIPKGKYFAAFGVMEENGYWPPHLHFQLMFDMQGMKGDYPGVCQLSKRDAFLQNCPDPSIILKHTFKSAMPSVKNI